NSSDDQSKDDQSKDDQSSTDQSGDLSVQSVTAQSTDSSSDDSQSNSTDDGDDDSQDNGHDDGHHETHGDDDDDENCTTTTTADLTLNKVVVNDSNGTATVADFTLVATSSVGGVDVISGPDPVAGSPVGISATVPVSDTYVLSEMGPDGYQASAWSCSAGTLNGDTLTLVAGDVANCTITNDDIASLPATITVDKFLAAPVWGGTLVAGDFQLTIDGVDAAQAIAHDVSPGLHTIGESPARPGYALVGTVCTDLDTNAQLSTDGTVTVVAGQNVHCVVTNQEIPATLTLTKAVDNTNGGHAVPSDFQLQIDGGPADQNTQIPVKAGPHTISEAPTAGYRLVSIACTDDGTHAAVTYNNGISLALDQHVSCLLTNVSDPVDLVITKSDDGMPHDAGGPAFDYTITVDNLGPRDATGIDPVTVTDQLPAGLEFVAFPTPACSAVGQVLTCDISPADLQLADPPVVITVTVKANPDAPSGTYTNMAFVNTADDPACAGTGCVPVCAPASNNVACETTQITRHAGISITKIANVVGPIHPGTTYTYSITVHNPGPSSYPAGNMMMTDTLPAELAFVSISAPSPWTCNNSAAISCTYGAVLAPSTDAAVITLTVTLDINFAGQTVVNNATAIARVEGPASAQPGLLTDTPPPDPIVVTATDQATTTIVRNANLAIDKSVSQTSAAIGDQFNWILDITNHGPDLATNVVISDTVPAAFQVIGTFPGAGLSCSNTANSVQCTAASLANGATLHAVVQVRVVAGATPGLVSNTATVVADSTDAVTSDNSDTASITVTAAASLAPVPPAPTSAPVGSGASLPRTGNESLSLPLTLAGLMIIGGTFSLVMARRRRAATA
ncbi:MAG: large repetitive protein, partial [Ilumatobacteraceae bacterium]|nr:large repetitive protein [Ilumatobacteraceae bacterium]